MAIDDVEVENACIRFVAGAQHHGHVTVRPSPDGENHVLNQTVDNVERYGTVVDNELLACHASIHSDLLLHSSQGNKSERLRCDLTLRYCSPDVRGMMEWNMEGILLSGADPEWHWGNPPRPAKHYEGT